MLIFLVGVKGLSVTVIFVMSCLFSEDECSLNYKERFSRNWCREENVSSDFALLDYPRISFAVLLYLLRRTFNLSCLFEYLSNLSNMHSVSTERGKSPLEILSSLQEGFSDLWVDQKTLQQSVHFLSIFLQQLASLFGSENYSLGDQHFDNSYFGEKMLTSHVT